MLNRPLPVAGTYRDAFMFALLQQLPWAVVCLLLLDGGRMAKICGVAMIGFWSLTLLIVLRRPLAPTATDLRLMRWGFFPLFFLTVLIASAV